MPSFPLIDTHLHLWDPRHLRHSWLGESALLNRPYTVADYRVDSQGIDIESMVFLECHVDDAPGRGQYIREIEFADREAQCDPRIRAIVAKAPLERGLEVLPILEEMVARFPRLRGIRRILEFEPDPRSFMVDSQFVAGVNLLHRFGLHFELTINYTQTDAALQFLELVGEMPVVLDHCGKPGIKGRHIELFRRHAKAFAAHPNVVFKLSGLAVEADWNTWTQKDLGPFIDATLEAFGVERVMYGGDWPVCLQATTLQRWVGALDEALAGLSHRELRRIYRDNAHHFYRLEY
jgi:L-fuconolactonase